ncbi:MAG: aspartate kinase [Pseudomonadota bacterium]
MALVVQKYGGTSVGDVDRIRNVAARVIKAREAGNKMVVVLSAMAGETDKLLSLARKVTERPDDREMDVLISTGEQVSIALFAMMIKALGHDACSFLGHQVRIRTDNAYGRARIADIDTEAIMNCLNQGRVAVVAGFQGADDTGSITTLGRGGSDTTAVALAAALKADVCEIYTDVDGVYTTDPNIVRDARKLPRISYDEMLEMASLGAKVLQIRSVEFAKKYDVPIHVRSSFTEDEGTMVVREDEGMEKVAVSGVTYSKDVGRITIMKVPDRPGIAAKVFEPLARAGVVVDMIIQNTGADGLTDLTFTVSRGDFSRAMESAGAVARRLGGQRVLGDSSLAKVSIVGVGMRSHAGVASKMFDALAAEGINIIMITTSEIKVSCVVEEKYTELAVRVLHQAFELNKVPQEETLI